MGNTLSATSRGGLKERPNTDEVKRQLELLRRASFDNLLTAESRSGTATTTLTSNASSSDDNDYGNDDDDDDDNVDDDNGGDGQQTSQSASSLKRNKGGLLVDFPRGDRPRTRRSSIYDDNSSVTNNGKNNNNDASTLSTTSGKPPLLPTAATNTTTVSFCSSSFSSPSSEKAKSSSSNNNKRHSGTGGSSLKFRPIQSLSNLGKAIDEYFFPPIKPLPMSSMTTASDGCIGSKSPRVRHRHHQPHKQATILLWSCKTEEEHRKTVQHVLNTISDKKGLLGLQSIGFEYRTVPCAVHDVTKTTPALTTTAAADAKEMELKNSIGNDFTTRNENYKMGVICNDGSMRVESNVIPSSAQLISATVCEEETKMECDVSTSGIETHEESVNESEGGQEMNMTVEDKTNDQDGETTESGVVNQKEENVSMDDKALDYDGTTEHYEGNEQPNSSSGNEEPSEAAMLSMTTKDTSVKDSSLTPDSFASHSSSPETVDCFATAENQNDTAPIVSEKDENNKDDKDEPTAVSCFATNNTKDSVDDDGALAVMAAAVEEEEEKQENDTTTKTKDVPSDDRSSDADEKRLRSSSLTSTSSSCPDCSTRLFHVPTNTMITADNREKYISDGEMYDEIARLCQEYAQDLMIKEGQLEWVTICNEKSHEGQEPIRALVDKDHHLAMVNGSIYVTHNSCSCSDGTTNDKSKQKKNPTLLIVTGKGKVRAGIFSRQHLLTTGLEPSTALPMVKEAKKRGLRVAIIDPNARGDREGMVTFERSVKKLFGHDDGAHNTPKSNSTMTSNVDGNPQQGHDNVPSNPSSGDDDEQQSDNDPLYVIAHSAAGAQLVRYLRDYTNHLLPSIRAIAFTDSTHNIQWTKDNPHLSNLLQSPSCVYYRSSSVHHDDEWDKRQPGDKVDVDHFWQHRFGKIRTFWAGTKEHSLTNWFVHGHIWDHFDQHYNEQGRNNSNDDDEKEEGNKGLVSLTEARKDRHGRPLGVITV